MNLHLIDATWELFRAYFAVPGRRAADGREVGAVGGVLSSVLALLQRPDVTHVGCATDQVITSWRNREFDGYKTGEGVEPDLLSQFPLVEEGLRALGVTVWPMVEFEADDAIASAVSRFSGDFERIFVCAPDKDFAQLVRGEAVVMWDRKKDLFVDEAGVLARWGVAPGAIPDWLALVGDTADGLPGVPGWGPKSAAALLARYGNLDAIPSDPTTWDVTVRGAARLGETLGEHRDAARLYCRLATLRTDAPVTESAEDLRWKGVAPEWAGFCDRLGFKSLKARAEKARA